MVWTRIPKALRSKLQCRHGPGTRLVHRRHTCGKAPRGTTKSLKTKLTLEPKPTEGITTLTTWTPVGQVTMRQQNARRKQHPPENSNRAQNLTVRSSAALEIQNPLANRNAEHSQHPQGKHKHQPSDDVTLELLDEAFKAAITHMLHEVMVNRFEISARIEVLRREITTSRKNLVEILELKNTVTKFLFFKEPQNGRTEITERASELEHRLTGYPTCMREKKDWKKKKKNKKPWT